MKKTKKTTKSKPIVTSEQRFFNEAQDKFKKARGTPRVPVVAIQKKPLAKDWSKHPAYAEGLKWGKEEHDALQESFNELTSHIARVASERDRFRADYKDSEARRQSMCFQLLGFNTISRLGALGLFIRRLVGIRPEIY